MHEKHNSNLSWVLGHHAVQAIISTAPERAVEVYVVSNSRNPALASIIDSVRQLGIPVQQADKREITKRCGTEQHQGIALRAKAKKDGNEKQLEQLVEKLLSAEHPPLLLILDQVQDPHNFGACLRTADAAGVSAVIVAKDNASPMTPVVQKVASGAAETVAIFRVTNLARTMENLQQAGIWLIGTSDQATHSVYQQDLRGPLALVMGAEGKGLRQLTEKKCDGLVSIPMAGSVVSSLNVSVATGVCLYEAVRQRSV